MNSVIYQEITCLYPSLQPFYTRVELYADHSMTPFLLPTPQSSTPDIGAITVGFHKWVVANPLFPWLSCLVYLAAIFCGKALMDRYRPEGFGLRRPLLIWNALLSLFSTIGFLRTLPMLLHRLGPAYDTWEGFFCGDAVEYGSGSTGFWLALFIGSKVLEVRETMRGPDDYKIHTPVPPARGEG